MRSSNLFAALLLPLLVSPGTAYAQAHPYPAKTASRGILAIAQSPQVSVFGSGPGFTQIAGTTRTPGSAQVLGIAQPSGPAPADHLTLTRTAAEKLALANNPRIQVSDLLARVQHQAVRERRADELPNLNGSFTGVGAVEGSRISSGTLTASRLLNHVGGGVQLTQLITDFGRTRNLIASAQLQEKARVANAEATRADIVLATDQVFYQMIEAQDTVKVAQQTVGARQTVTDQVSALTAAKLKSDLDLSFAQVNLSQAKLLVLDAQNNLDAARAALEAVLGLDHQVSFTLVEDVQTLPALPPDANALVLQAIENRPDLRALRFAEEADRKFSRAQRDQRLPTVSALGVVGGTPVGSSTYFTSNWYGAVGGNLNLPIFNGFRYSAQAEEASLQAQAASQQTRALRDQVVRDVRTAWLNANTSLQRVSVTDELQKQADTGLQLAQTRYDLGLSSIVELSQAQLQQTQAAIANADARSQYGLALSTIRFQTGTQP